MNNVEPWWSSSCSLQKQVVCWRILRRMQVINRLKTGQTGQTKLVSAAPHLFLGTWVLVAPRQNIECILLETIPNDARLGLLQPKIYAISLLYWYEGTRKSCTITIVLLIHVWSPNQS